jgi:hypothetical protein
LGTKQSDHIQKDLTKSILQWLTLILREFDIKVGSMALDYQLLNHHYKVKHLIISLFHCVPGVPRGKMERFAGVDTHICASPHCCCPKDFYEGEGFG